MKKKLLVLVGLAAMLMTGCGEKEPHVEEVQTEAVSVLDEKVDELTKSGEDLMSKVIDMYVEAAYEVFGDDFEADKAIYDDRGIFYKERLVSWEYLEEYAYNSMNNMWN